MGRVSSAQSGQRLSFLLVALASASPLSLFRWVLSNNEIPSTIGRWFRERAVLDDPTQALPFMFHSFQDYLLQVAVGERAGSIIEDVERHALHDQLGNELSKKTKAFQPF